LHSRNIRREGGIIIHERFALQEHQKGGGYYYTWEVCTAGTSEGRGVLLYLGGLHCSTLRREGGIIIPDRIALQEHQKGGGGGLLLYLIELHCRNIRREGVAIIPDRIALQEHQKGGGCYYT
jgi:hypothetical protein